MAGDDRIRVETCNACLSVSKHGLSAVQQYVVPNGRAIALLKTLMRESDRVALRLYVLKACYD